MADLAPKVAEVRTKFLSKYNGSILDDTYHAKDVEWVKSSDAFIRNALRAYKTGGDVNKAVDLINEIFLFRNKYKLNDIKKEDLDQELRELDGVYYNGVDKKGHKLIHFRVSRQKNGYKIKETKQYIAYHFNLHYMEKPEEQIVPFFDMTDASVSNMDLELSKFIIHCVSSDFPNLGAYNLMFRMGVALEAVWTIIKGWLDADQAKRTYMVTRKNVQEYIAEDQLLPHMIKKDK